MEQSLMKGYVCPGNKKSTFKCFIGYKWDHKNKNDRHKINLLQNWTEHK